MKTCTDCGEDFSADYVDLSGVCAECADGDPNALVVEPVE